MTTNNDVPKTLSIEEYRNIRFTDEEEWNNMFFPKRMSIEALHSIEIKKRGKGTDKALFTSMEDCIKNNKAPYYDPKCIHLHIWKNYKCITNLSGPQDPSVEYIQFTDTRPGTYCCICHTLKKSTNFKWRNTLDTECTEVPECMKHGTLSDLNLNFQINENIPECKPKITYIKHLPDEKVLYPISPYKSLYLNKSELTPYQKFILANPKYKDSCIFVKSDLEYFRQNYAYISFKK